MTGMVPYGHLGESGSRHESTQRTGHAKGALFCLQCPAQPRSISSIPCTHAAPPQYFRDYGQPSKRTRRAQPRPRQGVFRRAANLEFPTGIGTLQLFFRTAVNVFVNHGDRHVLFKVISAITGLPYAELAYERVNRCASKRGRAGYRSAAGTAMMSLLLSSGRPLRLLTFLSIGGAGLNLLYSVYIDVVNILKDEVAEGWTSLSAQITGLFFILFLVLAVLSEYVLRIFST